MEHPLLRWYKRLDPPHKRDPFKPFKNYVIDFENTLRRFERARTIEEERLLLKVIDDAYHRIDAYPLPPGPRDRAAVQKIKSKCLLKFEKIQEYHDANKYSWLNILKGDLLMVDPIDEAWMNAERRYGLRGVTEMGYLRVR